MTANEAQHAAGRAWAARYRRYAPTTASQAAHDHEAEEAREEASAVFRGGNR